MANNIALFKRYIDLLDEVYEAESTTAELDSDASLARAGANANEIVIPKLSMDGLANYSRNSGYVSGDVDLTLETVQFNYDRGRSFQVDRMDDEETAGVAFGKLASEFIRTKVVPEIDAFRYATYAGISGISTATGTLSTGEDVINALNTAMAKMDEDGVPAEGRVLRITSALLRKARAVASTVNKDVLDEFASIRTVPAARFNTEVTLKDGTTSGQTAGGFAGSGYAINFMIIDKSALMQYTKHNFDKIISPDDNQDADAWKFNYRNYGLADAYENKVAGIYCHAVNF
jgi:hypothetical protein